MKTHKHLFHFMTLILLWAFVGISCKKEGIEPDLQNCLKGCCSQYAALPFVAKLDKKAVAGFLDGGLIFFKEPIIDTTLAANSCASKEVSYALVCETDKVWYEEQLNKFKSDPNFNASQYSIWGTLYLNIDIIPFDACSNIYSVKITQIQKF